MTGLQINRTGKTPRNKTPTYGQLFFIKGGNNTQQRKDSLFNQWCWENWTATCKKIKLEYFLIPYTEINSKWIKYINVRLDNIKFLE